MIESRRRSATIVFALFLMGVVGGGTFVAMAAQDAVLESRSGSVSEVILDPAAPGFRAFTEATPTVLVAHTSIAGPGQELLGVSILTPADAAVGGTVITVQSTFAADSSSPALRDIYRSGGLDSVASTLGEVAATGFTSTVELDGEQWVSLIGDDAPLTLTLRTDLIETQESFGSVVVDADTRGFTPEELLTIVIHQNPSEPSLGAALRHQEVWRAWISQTQGTSERSVLADTGGEEFARVLAALESGEVSFRTIPTSTRAVGPTEDTAYIADESEIRNVFAQIVPFPTEVVPGDRPAVLLLDSTGGVVESNVFVEQIARSGGRVTILGNTVGEQEARNRVQFHDTAGGPLAVEIAGALGVSDVEDVPLDGATTSVTVIIAAPLPGS